MGALGVGVRPCWPAKQAAGKGNQSQSVGPRGSTTENSKKSALLGLETVGSGREGGTWKGERGEIACVRLHVRKFLSGN